MNDVDNLIAQFSGLTEEYKFYNDTITLRYDAKEHVYYLVNNDELEELPGVTTVAHIIDKSVVLIPWATKMMYQKAQVLAEPFVTGKGSDAEVRMPKAIFDNILEMSKTAHKEKLEDAGDVGHKVHAWIEDYINAQLENDTEKVNLILNNTPEDIRAKSACIASLDWQTRHNVRWMFTERKVYSRQHKYAGTCDGLAYVDSCDDLMCCKSEFKDQLAVIDHKTSNYLYNEFCLQLAAYLQALEEELGIEIKHRFIVRLGKDDASFEVWHLEDDSYEEDFAAFLGALVLKRAMEVVEHRMLNERAAHQVWKKKKKEEEKAELYKIACKGSGTYKGTRKPRCNNGNPCQSCLKKYQEVQAKKLAEIVKKDINLLGCADCGCVESGHDGTACCGLGGSCMCDGVFKPKKT